jgi:hypothetical protein
MVESPLTRPHLQALWVRHLSLADAYRDRVAAGDYARRTRGVHAYIPSNTADGAQPTHAVRAVRCPDSPRLYGACFSASAVGAPFGTADPHKRTALEPGSSVKTPFCTLDTAASAPILALEPLFNWNAAPAAMSGGRGRRGTASIHSDGVFARALFEHADGFIRCPELPFTPTWEESISLWWNANRRSLIGGLNLPRCA